MRSYSSLILHGEEDDQQDPLLNQTPMTMDDQIWTPDQDDDINALLHDDSIFYGGGGDLFPSIPDFPAISSSSSSSSSTSSAAAVKPAMSTSSSASSSKSSYCYQMVDTPGAPAAGGGALSSTASMRIPELNTTAGTDLDCCVVDRMDDFGYSDLIGSEDLLMDDPPTCSHHDSIFADDFQPQDGGGGGGDIQEEPTAPAEDDLGEVFLEWLKNNKENVSADDLRRIKIKKSTIDAAAKRLGGGKEAMKKLLKLILEWVQTSHLRPRRTNSNNNNEIISTAEADVATTTDYDNSDPALALPSYDNYPDPTTQINPWAPPVLGYPCGTDPFGNGGGVGPNFNGLDYNPTSSQTQMMIEPAHSWPSSPFPMPPAPPHYAAAAYEGCLTQPGGISGYLNLNQNQQYSYPYMNLNQNQDQGGGVDNNNRLVRLGSSATKEARKKRMARQRRFFSHRSRHNINPAGVENDERQFDPTLLQQQQGNLVYWPLPLQQGVSADPTVAPLSVPVDGSAALQQTVDRPPQSHQKQQGGAASDKRKGWKAEKNLRFLLQKVLKQSDVGSLGRIVLPKKEAEMHLPELEARDGISIAMEDIGTSRVWNMRYRFWPNNKSRMYLLESTGDFVRANGLQEGDFIVIYSDVKCGKYLIRGVKVRQPIGLKPESKKATAGHGTKAQKKGSTSLPSATANTSLVNESDRWRSEMTRNPEQLTNL
ncbi:Regulatory protein viviparous-1 [Linum perenne]